MKKVIACVLLLVVPLVPQGAEAATFKSCVSLLRKYPNGVAKSRADANKQSPKPVVLPSVYRVNVKLDRDRDGTACEVKSGIVVNLPNGASTVVSTTTTTPARTFTASAPWGEISAQQIFAPQPGTCVEIPLIVDIRSQSGLAIGLIISAEDKYSNLIGEARPKTPVGIQNVPIKVCREAWVYTFPSGVTSNRAATLYCGVDIEFYPSFVILNYMFQDTVCTSNSARIP